ncbi:GntR family transcriptional regulator [Micromonospora sp. NPDC050495]|uniref:GntR family transcriptional regulator n=1 Tax=Micromonospora sp. NPDC050495 TaxID=3154936 RepID=UPI0033C66253
MSTSGRPRPGPISASAQRIANGEFPPGAKLPSRRELIEHYGVTASELRERAGVRR